ncbi:MAG: hypothetical protein FJ004_10700 [Chloroflexi bacterium]|nr:hypothetical protein [Chloroflexota bacterium]
MQYPLRASFSKISFAQQIRVTDASGLSILNVRETLCGNFKEITIYAEEQDTEKRYRINVERIAGFARYYYFADQDGVRVGSVKQREILKFWKAHYDIYNGLTPIMTIRETNSFVRAAGCLLGLFVVLAWFSGYVLRPTYLVTNDSDNRVMMKMKETPSFFKKSFIIERVGDIGDQEQILALLGLTMSILQKVRWGVFISNVDISLE